MSDHTILVVQVIKTFCIVLLWDGFGHHFVYSVTNSIHSSSGILFTRSNPLNRHLHYITVSDLIKVILELPGGFLYVLQFKYEFGNKEFMI